MFDFEKNGQLSVIDLMNLGMSQKVANIFMFELLKPLENEKGKMKKELLELREFVDRVANWEGIPVNSELVKINSDALYLQDKREE